MHKIIGFILLAFVSAQAADYNCKATLTENIKVLWVKHKAVEGIDYRKPIDPGLILESKVLNKEGLTDDVSKYGYHATSIDGVAVVLFTIDYKHPLANFSFSDKLKNAKQNTNPGYEYDYYLQMYDAAGEKLEFGTDENLVALDQTAGVGFRYNVFNLAKYDTRTKRYDLQLSLTKLGFKKGGGSIMYGGHGNFRFYKGARDVIGEMSTSVGFVNDEDPSDESTGGMKSDSIDVECVRK